jgi:hypothetical protein
MINFAIWTEFDFGKKKGKKATYVTGLFVKEFLAIKYQAAVVCGSNQVKKSKK